MAGTKHKLVRCHSAFIVNSTHLPYFTILRILLLLITTLLALLREKSYNLQTEISQMISPMTTDLL